FSFGPEHELAYERLVVRPVHPRRHRPDPLEPVVADDLRRARRVPAGVVVHVLAAGAPPGPQLQGSDPTLVGVGRDAMEHALGAQRSRASAGATFDGDARSVGTQVTGWTHGAAAGGGAVPAVVAGGDTEDVGRS